jgi:hypothetical protein
MSDFRAHAAGDNAATNLSKQDAEPEKPKRPYRRVTRTLSPEEWTRERHPQWGRREEVAIFEGGSLASVDKKIASRDYTAVKDGDSVRIFIDSVFDHFDRLLARPLPPKQPRMPDAPKRPRGRPKKKASPDSAPGPEGVA